MKKVAYLMTIVIALTLMSFSCEKEDPIVPDTLELLYPDWSDLVWVSTDNNSEVSTYPKLNISIVGNVVTINQPINSTGGAYNGKYTQIIINGNTITFDDSNPADDENDPTVSGTFIKSGGQITLTTKGLSTASHVYVLQIN